MLGFVFSEATEKLKVRGCVVFFSFLLSNDMTWSGGEDKTYGYLSRASDMMDRECRHCAWTFRSFSVGTSS